MTSVLFSYYDKQIGAYTAPNPFQGTIEDLKTCIIRAVKGKALKMPNMDVLDLYCMGTFDDETGVITTPEKPLYLLALCEYIPVAQPKKEEATDGENRPA